MRTALRRVLALLRFLRFGPQELEKLRQQNRQKQIQFQRVKQRLHAVKQQNRQMRRRLKQKNQQLQRAQRQLGHKGHLPKQLAREYLLHKMPKQSVCAEIGVDEGTFSRQILDAVSPRRLHLIDPWKHEGDDQYGSSRYGGLGSRGQAIMDERCEKVRERFAGEISADQVKMHRGFSTEISEEFEDSYFDWVYIDGNHLYKFVRQDLRLYYSKVKPGGYITSDDYGVWGWWENGVQEAVDEFVAENPEATLEVQGTQFIIEKKGDSAAERLSRVDQDFAPSN